MEGSDQGRLRVNEVERIVIHIFKEVLVGADVAFIASGQSLNPGESLQAGVATVERRLQELASHPATEVFTYVGPGENDPERWYRMQSNGKWYGVRACCRPCATRLIQNWGVTDHEPDPAWLVKL